MTHSRSYGYRISYIARLVRTRFDERARQIGLTRSQWQTVATIRLREGSAQREIADALDVSTVTIGRIVERLEQDGWIEKRPDASDRRAHRLYLKEGAKPILEKLGAIAADEEQVTLAGLSEDERSVLSGLLDRIIGNLELRGEPTASDAKAGV